MKRALSAVLLVGLCMSLLAQSSTSTSSKSSTAEKSLASRLNVYVFPNENQSASVQSRDEGVCYQWAVEKTGNDPFRLAEKAQAQARASEYNSTAAEGSAVRGAAGGAAAGALIGAIAGSPGTGAAIGAVSGAFINRRRAKKAQEENQASIDAASQATAGQISNFKKAFSACLESKKYLVKY